MAACFFASGNGDSLPARWHYGLCSSHAHVITCTPSPLLCLLVRSKSDLQHWRGDDCIRPDSREIQNCAGKQTLFLPRVSQTLKFEGTVLKTTITFDNLLEGLMELTESTIIVTVYYMRRMYLNISQKKGCIGQNLGVFQSAERHCSQDALPSWHWCRTAWPRCSEFSLGCSYIGITGECPCGCTRHPGWLMLNDPKSPS